MNSILAASKREIDWTLDLTFPDATEFKFATAPLVLPKGTYTNDLESVKEIRQTLESPADRVGVAVQNKDRVLGLHVAANWQKWRKAESVIGRYYRDADGLGLSEWKEMFRGVVQQPNANDFQVTFDVIADTLSPGQIVTNRTLGSACPFLFKHLKTCGYTGGLTTCNHLLKSPAGCDGRNNAHHYGGMEHRYMPAVVIPGTGGNPIEPFPPGGCPRLDQYVRVRGNDNQPIPKMVCFFTEEDELWHPITRTFHKTKSTEIVRGVPIWELVTQFGAVGYSSGSHPIIQDVNDNKGLALHKFTGGENILGVSDQLIETRALIARDTGEIGDVMRIEMEDGKIYCYGDSPDKLIAAHNTKPIEY